MRPACCGMIGLFLLILILTLISHTSYSQVWWVESTEEYDYDLSKFRILILLGEDFDYQETVVFRNHWETWGARVDIAGIAPEQTGHVWKKTKKGWDRSEERKINTDFLISHVDLSHYQALFFPGGNSPKSLLEEDSSQVVQLVQRANRKGLVLAAICHGPKVLAAAGVVNGRRITGHREIVKELADAGGTVVNEVCVVDGNIITGNWPYFGTMAAKVAEKLLYPDGGGPTEQSPFVTHPVLKTIKERRSIRRFEDTNVESEIIETLLRAAIWAPSANNDQPWKFVVSRNKEIKKQIANALIDKMKDYYEAKGVSLERIQAYWSGVFSAPVHIFAFCDTRHIEMDEEWKEIEMLHNIQGVSAACQNILLAAKALDLGSLWMGGPLVIEDTIKTLLHVPNEVKLVAIIAIGYSAHEPFPPVRRPLSEIVVYEKWEGKK